MGSLQWRTAKLKTVQSGWVTAMGVVKQEDPKCRARWGYTVSSKLASVNLCFK